MCVIGWQNVLKEYRKRSSKAAFFSLSFGVMIVVGEIIEYKFYN